MGINDLAEHLLPTDQVEASLAFVEEAIKTPDGYLGIAPWWHGWALRMAFHAGAAWAKAQK